MSTFGYNDNILIVDLTTGEIQTEQPGEKFYRQYLGGTYTPWRLFITGYHTGRNALVIGDSFSNAFIPYLTPYYDQIISTDFRRGKYVSSLAGASAADYIAEYDVDDIYMIYCTYTPIDSSTMQQYMESYLHMEY